jgi:dUTP pyrophosphatase
VSDLGHPPLQTIIDEAFKAMTHDIDVKVKLLTPTAQLPTYANEHAVGMDIRADLGPIDEIVIHPGERYMVPTGIAIALPAGFECQVRPRSGLAAKNAVTVVNTPGTIDPDYRGEIKVILINHGVGPFSIKPGDRIAQLVFAPVTRAALSLVPELDETVRGESGFGSTGIA